MLHDLKNKALNLFDRMQKRQSQALDAQACSIFQRHGITDLQPQDRKPPKPMSRAKALKELAKVYGMEDCKMMKRVIKLPHTGVTVRPNTSMETELLKLQECTGK